MNYDELHKKINAGEYSSTLFYPPYRKGKEERKRYLEPDTASKKDWNQDTHRLVQMFKADLKNYAETELGKPLTDTQLEVIWNKAWEDGHSSGYNEVLIYADEIIDVVKAFV